MTGKRKALAALAAAAIGLAAAAAGWRIWLKPRRDAQLLRAESLREISELYALQTAYKNARGAYANDLDSLAALAPGGAALKARLAAHLDMTTLDIRGDAAKFKIEANVLDAERTLIKIRGPLPTAGR